MAINVRFNGANIFRPGGSVTVQLNHPGFTRHESFIKIAHNNEDPGICIAALRALVGARIISGVRSDDLIVFHIDAKVPTDER